MKRIILLFCILFTLSANSQLTQEALDITNSLSSLWKKENSSEAIKSSIRLNDIYRPLLIDNIHHQLSLSIQRNKGDGKESSFLNDLYRKNIGSINQIIESAYLWNSTFKITTTKKANSLLKTYYSKFSDTINNTVKTELYGLLILKEFENKGIGSAKLKDKMLDKIFSNLSSSVAVIEPSLHRKVNLKRAEFRFLLAYIFNMRYEKNPTDSNLLKNSAKYSPDQKDLQITHAYYYNAVLLIGGPKNINYKNKYIDFLIDSNNHEEALNLLLERAFLTPTTKHLKNIKDYTSKIPNSKPFETIWYNYIHSHMKEVPPIKVEFELGTLDLTVKKDHWTYIDFWGTWCAPCVDELPEFNKVAHEYNSNADSKIKFYTFSYNSKNLKEFMSKNEYTFPVAEVSEEITKLFNVTGFPTRVFISPDNKYVKIPFRVDWKEYMRNYSQME